MIKPTNYWSVRIDKTLRNKVKFAALKENRTVSNWVSELIRRELEKKV